MNKEGLNFVINTIVKGCTKQMQNKKEYTLRGKIFKDEYWHVIFSDFSLPIKNALRDNGIRSTIYFELNDNDKVLKYTIVCWR